MPFSSPHLVEVEVGVVRSEAATLTECRKSRLAGSEEPVRQWRALGIRWPIKKGRQPVGRDLLEIIGVEKYNRVDFSHTSANYSPERSG